MSLIFGIFSCIFLSGKMINIDNMIMDDECIVKQMVNGKNKEI